MVHQNLQFREGLDATAEIAGSFFRADGVEIYLLDESIHSFLLKAHRGLSPHFVGSGFGEKLVKRVAGAGYPVFIDSLLREIEPDSTVVQQEGFTAYAGIPLAADETVLGVLGLYFKTTVDSVKKDSSLLAETGKQLGSAVLNMKKYERAVQKAQRLISISRAMTVTRQLGTLDRVLENISKMLVSVLGFDLSWIGLISDDQTLLEGRAGFGVGRKSELLSPGFPIQNRTDNPAVRVLREQKPFVFAMIEDISESPLKEWLVSLNVQSGGFVSVQSGEMVLGVIGCFYTSDRLFGEEDVRILTSVSEQASIAIENSKLYERIMTSEERYRTLFESTGTSMAIVNAQGYFKLVNRAFEELGGFASQDLIDKKNIFNFFLGKGSSGAEFSEKLIHPPQKWEEEFLDRKRDIKQVYVMTTPIPKSEDILVSLVDITRQRELEKQLYDSQELASLGELSAGIAHEIRNPLVAINTSVSILKDERALSPEGQQVLDVVKEETDHLAAIVNDFLKYARPKKLVLQAEDLNKLIKDSLKRYKEQYGEQIVWVERYDETLPAIRIDRHQFQQVIVNLLSNSMDAMPSGGKLFIETNYQTEKRGNRVLIVVKDTGTGIQTDLLAKIFLPFFSTKEKGTGMGLAICRRIVNQHNGEIFVESEPGKGAVFTVFLPIETVSSKPGE